MIASKAGPKRASASAIHAKASSLKAPGVSGAASKAASRGDGLRRASVGQVMQRIDHTLAPVGCRMLAHPLAPGKDLCAFQFGVDRLAIGHRKHLCLARKLGQRLQLLLRLVPLTGDRQQLEQEHARRLIGGLRSDGCDEGGTRPIDIARTQQSIGIRHVLARDQLATF
jgi:hypothetical protein